MLLCLACGYPLASTVAHVDPERDAHPPLPWLDREDTVRRTRSSRLTMKASST